MTNVPQISETLRLNMASRPRERGYDSVKKFADACGLTPQGLLPLRRGEIRAYQDRLTGPVCRTLGWSLDSIERMMAGDDPLEAEPAPALDVSSELAEIRRLVETIQRTVGDERSEAARH